VSSPANARVRLTGAALGAPIMSFVGRFENVRAGTYLIELLAPDNKVLQSRQIAVAEGQTTTVTF
jgi:hypothetical protein